MNAFVSEQMETRRLLRKLLKIPGVQFMGKGEWIRGDKVLTVKMNQAW